MNILQVCAYAAPYPGNFIKSLLSLHEELRKNGHNTFYAFPEKAQSFEWCKELQKRTDVYFLPLSKARINPKTYIELRKIMKTKKIDIVHSHFELYDIPIAVSLPKNTKMFWHLHDAIENDFNNTSYIRKCLFKLHYGIFSKKAYLISVSEKHADFAMRLGFKKERCSVILNGTDLNRIKNNYVKSNKKYDFLMFGWDFERKGVDLAIKASQQLVKDGYKFNIAVVGSNDTWNNPKIKEIENEEWFFKQNFVEDINDLYADANIFLHVSRAEGCSYALQESIYFGLPIISSDIPENLFVKNIPSVILCKNSDYNDLYLKMKMLLDNRLKITENDIENSRQFINNNFSIEVWTKKIIKEYFNKMI